MKKWEDYKKEQGIIIDDATYLILVRWDGKAPKYFRRDVKILGFHGSKRIFVPGIYFANVIKVWANKYGAKSVRIFKEI